MTDRGPDTKRVSKVRWSCLGRDLLDEENPLQDLFGKTKKQTKHGDDKMYLEDIAQIKIVNDYTVKLMRQHEQDDV